MKKKKKNAFNEKLKLEFLKKKKTTGFLRTFGFLESITTNNTLGDGQKII